MLRCVLFAPNFRHSAIFPMLGGLLRLDTLVIHLGVGPLAVAANGLATLRADHVTPSNNYAVTTDGVW